MPKLNKNQGTEALRSKLILIYANLVKSGVLFPKRSDLIEAGLSRDSMRHHFGTIGNLRKIAKERHPDAFKNELSLDDYLSNSNLKKIHSRVKKHNKFFITTAIAGQAVHKEFLESINTFCKINKAKLILLPSHDPAHNLDSEVNWMFDENIKHTEFDYIFEDLRLNSNLMISGIRVTAKQINPVTGLSELSQKEGSCIFASPKQSLEYDAVSANRLPHARMTTGAITLPNYNTTRGNSLRTSYIATFQHVVGGIVVEIADDNIFHFTQVQADKNGSFCHMGKEYSKNKCVQVPVSFIMGDLHAGEHDIKALNAWKEIIKEVKAYQVVFHDTFDGKSISHWTEQDALVRAELAMSGENSLENELKLVRDILDDVLSIPSVKKGVIVKSNHDDFLDRYLKRGGFMKDPINFKLGCQLAAEVVNTHKDVLEHGIKLVGVGKQHKKIKFLGVNEDYLIGDVHAGAHGDRSSNGSKGAIKSLAKSFSKGVFGHSHTPGIFKKAFQVGTTSKLRQGYNKGPSSWVHCSALVYDNGQVQLINALEGKWRSNKK